MAASFLTSKLALAAFGAAALSFGAGLFGGQAPGKFDYRLTIKPTVMTVAYKAYGNREAADGKYWMARMVMGNSGESALKDVTVSYRIPDYVDWTTPQTIPAVLPGQTRVLPIYPKLPAKVTNLRSRTPGSLEVKLAWNDGEKDHEKIEVREFDFRGVNEIEYTSLPSDEVLSWYDVYDNAEICAAFVTYEDPVVRQYLGEVSETMGGFPICSNAEELIKAMRSIYDYQVATGMKYAGNTGVPENLGEASSYVQNIRLPRDVVYQNSGLCIELAMLWAALGQGASAKAHLALIPGHCFPVLEAADGSIIAIEATGIGGSNVGGTMSFEEALQSGNKTLNQLAAGEIPGVLIDVQLHQGRGIRPPEFETVDLAGLARLLDERTAKARQNAEPRRDDNGPEPRREERRDEPVANSDWQWHKVAGLNAQVPYPKNYQSQPQVVQQVAQALPSFTFLASSPDGNDSIEIYAAAGMTGQQLRSSIQDLMGQYGGRIRYQGGESTTIGGQQAKLYPYSADMNGQTLQGGLYVYETNAGLFAFAVGGGGNNWRNLGDRIAAAVRFGN
ncbi:MAG: hypothetical protein R3F33_06465 [Planctomycetota bacterium]